MANMPTMSAPELGPIIGNDGKQKFTNAPFFSQLKAILRLPNEVAFRNPLTDWRPWTAEKCNGKPHPAFDPRKRDVDVKLTQYLRLSGIKGTSVLSRADMHFGKKGEGRMVTAQGREDVIVSDNPCGLSPSEIRPILMPSDGESFTVSGSEVRYLRRYRDMLRGERFAESMEGERAARWQAMWRAAFPYIPTKRDGTLVEGKRYNRADGIGERVYNDGTMLSERKREWMRDNPEASLYAGADENHSQLDRDAEIAALVAESKKDEATTRTVRVTLADLCDAETRKALRF